MTRVAVGHLVHDSEEEGRARKIHEGAVRHEVAEDASHGQRAEDGAHNIERVDTTCSIAPQVDVMTQSRHPWVSGTGWDNYTLELSLELGAHLLTLEPGQQRGCGETQRGHRGDGVAARWVAG